jgi:hypothetical protein
MTSAAGTHMNTESSASELSTLRAQCADLVQALQSIRDVAYFAVGGETYYRKAENALAAYERRDAVAQSSLPPVRADRTPQPSGQSTQGNSPEIPDTLSGRHKRTADEVQPVADGRPDPATVEGIFGTCKAGGHHAV